MDFCGIISQLKKSFINRTFCDILRNIQYVFLFCIHLTQLFSHECLFLKNIYNLKNPETLID